MLITDASEAGNTSGHTVIFPDYHYHQLDVFASYLSSELLDNDVVLPNNSVVYPAIIYSLSNKRTLTVGCSVQHPLANNQHWQGQSRLAGHRGPARKFEARTRAQVLIWLHTYFMLAGPWAQNRGQALLGSRMNVTTAAEPREKGSCPESFSSASEGCAWLVLTGDHHGPCQLLQRNLLDKDHPELEDRKVKTLYAYF